MTTEPIEIFYSYAREDEQLRNKLNEHLALLKRQGIINEWYDRDITAGSLQADEINTHLNSARIILLLVSPSFIASEYCYSIEMIEALRRQEAGEAHVFPIILRPCVWESAPFGKLQALPKDGKAVTLWSNRDAAFTNIARGISKAIEALNEGTPITSLVDKAKEQSEGSGKKTGGRKNVQDSSNAPKMPNAPITLGSSALKPAITRYYKGLKELEGKADHELALRGAFQNLLADAARMVNWTLIPEQTIEDGIRPDGVMRDVNNLRRGYWEAKGPGRNLDKEIADKINKGYPLNNIIFENTKRAVLYQNKNKFAEYNLQDSHDVAALLQQFFTYTEPHIEHFQTAVLEFKANIPKLANDLLGIIETGHKQNAKFKTAFASFAQLCRVSLNPNLTDKAIDEMLVQHLLTERLFRTVFNNPDFVNRNIIAAEIEKVIQALTSRSFNRQEFFKSLDRYYVAIEGTARGIESWAERQEFLNTVYEGFFQGFSTKQADTHGIVYTPQEIVDFMCSSVEEVLQSEFHTSIAKPGVKILDPATGTGNFIVNLIRNHIPAYRLKEKYLHDLFCNEITLLPYYIASLNIEHEYYEKMGTYEPFGGICFADTLELAEGQQLSLFVEENTERVQREKDAQIMVVIGNPPYNVGQKNENDNNKNRRYPTIDNRIKETYAKGSKATLINKIYDVYVRFFRWATDRLQGRDGIVCFVSNNSFIDQLAFDSMRKHISQDFTTIYHIDLHGNVRRNPKLSGTTHNVFGIQVGVGITIAIRKSNSFARKLFYYRTPEDWTRIEKLSFLKEKENFKSIEWQELIPDERYTWLTDGIYPEFNTFLPIGSKDIKASRSHYTPVLFKSYSIGAATGRDKVVYNFNHTNLKRQVEAFIENYNIEVSRWFRANQPKDIDSFVDYEKIKWSRNLKRDLQNIRYADLDIINIRKALYRPFTTKWLYYSEILVDELGTCGSYFPTLESEKDNYVIVVSDHGYRSPFSTIATSMLPDQHVLASTDAFQVFPFYIYAKDGTNRRENITDWALQQFQTKYGPEVSKWDIFHSVYGMLHHPQYRERYAENLKRDLPHIPLLHRSEAFWTCVCIGKQLMDLHINYEQAKEYPSVEWLPTRDVPFSWRVEKMRLSTDKRVVVVNESLKLGPIPPECFEYRLGNRSALEWVIDQYQVSKDARSGIESDPNNLENEEYIIRLVGKVVTVSVETVRLVKELEQAVKAEDWLGEVGVQSE